MQMSNVAIFIFAIIAVVLLLFIITYVRRKNRRDLQRLEAELKRDADDNP